MSGCKGCRWEYVCRKEEDEHHHCVYKMNTSILGTPENKKERE